MGISKFGGMYVITGSERLSNSVFKEMEHIHGSIASLPPKDLQPITARLAPEPAVSQQQRNGQESWPHRPQKIQAGCVLSQSACV